MKTMQNSFFEKVEYIPFSDCWFWNGAVAKSWSYFNGRKIEGDLRGKFSYKRKNRFAHRISFLIHKGEIPKGNIICHTCDNSLCVNPSHLYAGDHRSNAVDMVKRARIRNRNGELNPRAKLNRKAVEFIRSFPNAYAMKEYLSSKLSVSVSTIKSVLSQRTWA